MKHGQFFLEEYGVMGFVVIKLISQNKILIMNYS